MRHRLLCLCRSKMTRHLFLVLGQVGDASVTLVSGG